MEAVQWTWPYELGSLVFVEIIWPVLEGWGETVKDKWRRFRDEVKRWITTHRTQFNNESHYLSSLWAAAEWAAAQCGISNWM
ncbi:hypothetical protein ACI3PL_21075, partial [Lacticaseibacillus paracasei]